MGILIFNPGEETAQIRHFTNRQAHEILYWIHLQLLLANKEREINETKKQ